MTLSRSMLAGSSEIQAVSASRSKVRHAAERTPEGQLIGARIVVPRPHSVCSPQFLRGRGCRYGRHAMRTEEHVASYWAATSGPEPDGIQTLEGDRRVDVAVIGGGYTGLAAAYRLAGTHGLETVVLEANRIGWGASGRNGGFALITLGKVGLEDRIRHWGLETARRSIALGVEA